MSYMSNCFVPDSVRARMSELNSCPVNFEHTTRKLKLKALKDAMGAAHVSPGSWITLPTGDMVRYTVPAGDPVPAPVKKPRKASGQIPDVVRDLLSAPIYRWLEENDWKSLESWDSRRQAVLASVEV